MLSNANPNDTQVPGGLASAGRDGQVLVWDLAAAAVLRKHLGHGEGEGIGGTNCQVPARGCEN